MMRLAGWLIAAATVACWAASGCAPVVPAAEYDQLHQQWLDSQQQRDDLARQRDGLQKENKELADGVETLRMLGSDRLAKLFTVTSIQLGRHTGGVDLDGRPGDDAVKVYLDPLDSHGSTIKAAGDVTIRLFDLAEQAEKTLIGEYHWSVDQLSEQWRGGFGVYRYSFVCPWKVVPPNHDEITVRVEFVDYLTGRRFTAQSACKVKSPPPQPPPASSSAPSTPLEALSSQPATRPGD
jgi:hypothetical protein